MSQEMIFFIHKAERFVNVGGDYYVLWYDENAEFEVQDARRSRSPLTVALLSLVTTLGAFSVRPVGPIH